MTMVNQSPQGIGNSCNLRSGNEIFRLSSSNYFIYRYLSRSAIKKNRAPALPVSVSLPNWDCTRYLSTVCAFKVFANNPPQVVFPKRHLGLCGQPKRGGALQKNLLWGENEHGNTFAGCSGSAGDDIRSIHGIRPAQLWRIDDCTERQPNRVTDTEPFGERSELHSGGRQRQ
jgi:hypothetical protein